MGVASESHLSQDEIGSGPGILGPEDVEGVDEADAVETMVDTVGAATDGEDGGAESDEPAVADVPLTDIRARQRRRLLFGLVVVIVLVVLSGWLGIRTFQAHQANVERSQFLGVARQSALNLTTIDWQHAEVDVNRVLDGLTGEFYEDFAARSQPFIEAVKKAQATSVGTMTEAGFESRSGDEAQVLVVVSVKTAYAGGGEEQARDWRMRIFVKRVDGQIKVSNVEFVP